MAALPEAAAWVRRLGGGARELGVGAQRPRAAPATSLNRRTGPRRRLTATSVDLSQVVPAAHRVGGTVNDVVLAAATGAMTEFLAIRGEHPGDLVVSVPVSARRTDAHGDLGNEVGVRPLRVPTMSDPRERLRRIVALTADQPKAGRGSSAVPLGLVFRGLAAAGVFQRFVDHQRLVNTFLTNVHGPSRVLHFAGRPIREILPMGQVSGNIGVAFAVLSYAGQLAVTVLVDPDIIDDADQRLLTTMLRRTFDELVG